MRLRSRKCGLLGTYSVNRVESSAAQLAAGQAGFSMSFDCFGDRGHDPGAAALWRRRATGEPLPYGEWTRLAETGLTAWLEVALRMWSVAGNSDRSGADAVVRLDGTLFSSRAGFYCAVGEAVNGPGGYFGWNLDALHDCLRLARRGQSIETLVWDGFPEARTRLGETFLVAVVDILRENSVELVRR